MPWNGSGTFNRTYSWVADKNAGLNISSSRMDTDSNDTASNGFGNTLTRDGQGSASANLPMGGFRHTGVGNGAARTDYAALGQVQDGISINWTVGAGSADAITATYTPAITALVDGQLCFLRLGTTANVTATPTFAPNGLTARTITKSGGLSLSPGDIGGTLVEIILRYNLANTRWELLNPFSGVQPGTVVATARATADLGYLLCFGQNVSRTTYAALFAAIGTAWGAGDGSTTFGLPDLRSYVMVAPDSMGGSAANRLTTATRGGGWATAALAGGAETVTLTQAQLPAVAPTFTGTGGTATFTGNSVAVSSSGSIPVAGGAPTSINAPGTGANPVPAASSWSYPAITVTATGSVTSVAATGTISNLGSGTAHANVQPTQTINYQIKT